MQVSTRYSLASAAFLTHKKTHTSSNFRTNGKMKLGYVDFGLVAKVPVGVREALICSVIHLIERNFVALAAEFDSLMLIPTQELYKDFDLFVKELKEACDRILTYPNSFDQIKMIRTSENNEIEDERCTRLPKVNFNAVVAALLSIAIKFKFDVPPYFLNNARAIASLEGMALSANPDFNLLQVLYPFVARRLLLDPSPKIRESLCSVIKQKKDQRKIDWKRLWRLLEDASELGLKKRRLILDFFSSSFALSLLVRDLGARIEGIILRKMGRGS